MKCTECQFDNPDNQKFCGECGTKLEKSCQNCDFNNPPKYKFCGECGHNLIQPSEPTPKELTFDEKIEKIQKYLPKGLTDKILSQKDKIEGERKQVTVMFADMEGFTPLVEKLGPEEAYSIMDDVYEILIHKVHDYEGTVNEMTGDGIMALFGAPIALEDAPQRAIRSAHAIHREMTKFSDKIKQKKESIPQLKMRIGIHTGPVVVGTLGNDLRVEFKAVGDTVNLASRLEDLAEPGATYVTEETFKLTEGLFRFEALGEREIKGKVGARKIYQVIGPSSRRTRFDVSAERGLTHFIGRERELELLLDGFDRAKQGRGQAFSIMAEAGVGKSRLLYEFRKRVENEDITFLEGKCLSYSGSVAYHPIIDLYKSNFDIKESDDDAQIKGKVKKGFKQLDVDEASSLPYLLELLSVKDSGFDQIPMSPEGKKDQMIETMIRIPLKGSEIQPLVLAIEDLHWMDKSSEDVLKYMLESIAGAKILLIFTYRPEFVHMWGGKSFHNQLTLNRLSNRETLAMVTSLLNTEDVENDLEELILEKTEGVPFFIEEFIKSLKDLKIIEKVRNKYNLVNDIRDLAIPSTIQDVIMARVDSLPDDAKQVLQTGSVIEREFSYQLIKKVSGLLEKELLSNLSLLKDSEILFERGIFPDSTYIFKHALTREVVYDSILSKRKKILHGNVGNAIAKIYEDHIDEYYGILAEHYIDGENYVEGAKCSQLASRKAMKTGSFGEAIARAKKWIMCLENLPTTSEIDMKLIDARTTLGFYYVQQLRFDEAKMAIDPIIEITSKMDYKRRLPQVYTIRGIHAYACEEKFSEGTKLLKRAIKVAEETNNMASLSIAEHYLGHVFLEDCEFDKGYRHINKALQIVQMGSYLWTVALHKSCIAMNIYFMQGKIDLAYTTSSDGLRLAEESGDIQSRAEAHQAQGMCSYGKGFLEEAEKHCLMQLDFGERANLLGYVVPAYIYLGLINIKKGECLKAKDYLVDALSYEKEMKWGRYYFFRARIALARAKVMNNEKDVDLKSLYFWESQDTAKRYSGLNIRTIGEILLNLNGHHLSEAERMLMQAIETDKRNGMPFELAMDYTSYTELFKRKGDLQKAKENLNKAIEIFKECGSDGWVEKYEKELAALS